MLISKTQYSIKPKDKMKGELFSNRVPFSSPQNSYQFYRDINERPFKSNSDELSFKGLSFCANNENAKSEDKKKKIIDFKNNPTLAMLAAVLVAGASMRMLPRFKDAGTYSISEFNKFTQKHIGSIGTDLLEHLKKNDLAKDFMKIEGDKITFKKKTIPALVWDGMKYPFTILPADLLNGTIALLKKFKPTQKWAEKQYDTKFFKNIRQRSKIDSKMNALRGLFKKQQDLLAEIPAKGDTPARFRTEKEISDEMYRASVKMFDSKTGKYDTKHERALNRLVSGLPPAIFLANDAYNLSRMMDDDDKAAAKEKKIRFKQETSRILTSGYLTLITMGALQKFINNSKFGIMLTTGSTVLITEMFSRLANGKHITRLTPEEARQENIKNHAEEAKIKPTTAFTSDNKPKEENRKPLLSFSTLMKGSAIVIATGFAIKGLRKLDGVEKSINTMKAPFKNLYRKLTKNEHYSITTEKFNQIIKVLDENGFSDLSQKYKDVAKDATHGNIINLGVKDKKIKPLVDFVIAPFKFAWNTVTMPYWILDEKLLPAIIKGYRVAKPSKAADNIDALSKSIDNIGREALKKNFNPKQFRDFVRDNILKAFNVDNMSNVSNSDLSNLAKFSATAATLWFLMTDNYNMVMLKSNGNDVDGAKTKFKERFVQEGSRLFYQTLLIDLFNSTFRTQYNNSLFGMSWITLTNTTLGEILTRKSVGTPIKAHTRDELLAIEEAQDNATGLLKGYYNFMKRLTGKRPISSYKVAAKNENQSKIAENTTKPSDKINFANKGVLHQMVKG